ncbi:serine/threonine-protein kinase pim-2 isoform X2 [Eurytemora carolleeae]|uniref:serine/threonine-protein kinase pim-2 isoform X2 n=1 Tax=Eurytemora carolleeae TaxID=1294199 RepID=UPI000C783F92|nr:serine/threonine-protein kinase pim-2 isoform X2 [Eurytemora carolleeae]|eukprot:XP_023330949.1 serine/threonine-protein kinase pim-2-like isoform X2 [Eurytemora affinis]
MMQYHRTEEDFQRICFQELEIGLELGKGGYGLVKLATNNKGLRFGVKLVEKNRILKWTYEERKGESLSLPLEFSILNKLNYPSILKVVDVFESLEYFQIVVELVQGISLFDLIEKNGHLEEEVARWIFLQVTDAIRYLHGVGVLHNDIKDENIMVNKSGEIKLVDFGSACYHSNILTRNYCGSETYSSPEVAKEKKYCRTLQEIWSLGVLLFVMVCGSAPFQTILQVQDGDPEYPPGIHLSQDLLLLISAVLEKSPEKRFNLTQILSSPWVKLNLIKSPEFLVFD